MKLSNPTSTPETVLCLIIAALLIAFALYHSLRKLKADNDYNKWRAQQEAEDRNARRHRPSNW